MTPLAVDVAILLPATARSVLEQLNASCVPTPGGFRFDTTHHPHITLGQHFVDADAVDAVRADLTPLLSRHVPLEIAVTGGRRGHTAHVAVVAPTPDLQRLHEQVVGVLADHEVPGTAEAFQSDDSPARDADVRWVSRFRLDSSFGHFDPHITIGIGPGPVTVPPPWRFTATEVGLCRLGRFCTCRDPLTRWTL